MRTAEEVCKQLGFAESAIPMLSVVLTHESALGSSVDAYVAKALLESLRAVGHSALVAAIVECCFVDMHVSDQGMVDLQLPNLSRRVGDALISRFDLVSATRVGGGIDIMNPNYSEQQTFRTTLACRFLGAVVLCSSFDAVRNVVKKEVDIFRHACPN